MKEITHDDLCSMKLHEFSYLPGPENVSVLRVPGGWIYTLPLYDPARGAYVTLSSCFVPYSNVNSARTEGAEETEEYVHLQRDAERYRWLRARHWDTSPLAVVVDPKNSVKLGRDCPSKDRLDEAIDREMARAQLAAAMKQAREV